MASFSPFLFPSAHAWFEPASHGRFEPTTAPRSQAPLQAPKTPTPEPKKEALPQ